VKNLEVFARKTHGAQEKVFVLFVCFAGKNFWVFIASLLIQ